MLFRRLALAGALGILAGAAAAQNLRPPAELPPPGFTGQQYTDSRGCVFLRAGLSGQTNWVARIGSDRRQLCGYPPSFTPVTDTAEAATPRPAAAAEAPTAARTATPAPAPTRTAAEPTPPPAPPAVRATRGCPATAPFGQRAQRADGSVALFCSASQERLAAAIAALRAPAAAAAPAAVAAPAPAPAPRVARSTTAPAQAPVVPPVTPGISPDVRIVCPASAPNPQRVTLGDGSSAILCAGPDGDVRTAAAGLRRNGLTFAPVVPPGYRFAWEDDRLNPRRGQGTVEGQMAQDRVWTRDVPARAVTAPATQTAAAASAPQRQVTVSSSNSNQAAGRLFVQVGSYAVADNAQAARNRLSALGLPATSSRATIGGKAVQVVLAGPFAAADQARAALSAARGAGFSDAFIR